VVVTREWAPDIPESLHRAHILVVDDDSINLALVQRLLSRAGFEDVVATSDSRCVVSLCASRAPDLILLDLHMPAPDGFALLEQLKPWLAAPSETPLLVLSGDEQPATRLRALSGGARDFLAKPFDRAELLGMVRNLLETRPLERR
jgi:CheY-like chemotaxis protein